MTTSQHPRAIVGAIISGGRIYRAGDEADFATRMAGRDCGALVARGQLRGDWSDVTTTTPRPTKSRGAKRAKAAPAPTHVASAPVLEPALALDADDTVTDLSVTDEPPTVDPTTETAPV